MVVGVVVGVVGVVGVVVLVVVVFVFVYVAGVEGYGDGVDSGIASVTECFARSTSLTASGRRRGATHPCLLVSVFVESIICFRKFQSIGHLITMRNMLRTYAPHFRLR